MKKETGVITLKSYEITQPSQMVSMAKVLKDHVIAGKLYTGIQNKNYVHVEGWQFAGGLMGTFARVVSVKDLSNEKEVKWLAEVEIVNLKTSEVISRGFGVCSNKETKKKNFDEYAVLSMAQTRAIGKAYRNVIGWVMKLAGYEGTPSEEMTAAGSVTPAAPAVKETTDEPVIHVEPDALVCHGTTKSGCGEDITQQEYNYSKKMYGKPLCREHQKGAKPLKK